MAVTQDFADRQLWYFAYGSNMSTAKFIGSRGIHPLDIARVWLPGWILTLEIPGLPYSEPAFTSVRPATDTLEVGAPSVIGVAYLIMFEQYKRVIASEGGGAAYADIWVDALPVADKDATKTGQRLKVRTLGSAITRSPPARPSSRYMSIVRDGAAEAKLPTKYQHYLSQIPTYRTPQRSWQSLGAAVFTSIWGPVMNVLEKIVHTTTRRDGNAPPAVIGLVRTTMLVIWLSHDVFFSPIFGRGDGLDDKERDQWELQPFQTGKDAI